MFSLKSSQATFLVELARGFLVWFLKALCTSARWHLLILVSDSCPFPCGSCECLRGSHVYIPGYQNTVFLGWCFFSIIEVRTFQLSLLLKSWAGCLIQSRCQKDQRNVEWAVNMWIFLSPRKYSSQAWQARSNIARMRDHLKIPPWVVRL